MNLYEINQSILECYDPATGEIDSQRLEELNMAKKSKLESIALWIKNLKADAKAYKAEAAAFAERQQTAENKAASLKKYLDYQLQGEKFSTDRVLVSFRKSTSTVVDDELLIPEKYMKYTSAPMKDEIKKALQNGEPIPGAHLEEHRSIQVK